MMDDQRSRVGDAFERYVERSNRIAWIIIAVSAIFTIIYIMEWASAGFPIIE